MIGASRLFLGGGGWLGALCVAGAVAISAATVERAALGQEVIFDEDFSDNDLGAFFNPAGQMAINLCGQVIPAGLIAVDAGSLLMTNDAFLGLCLFSLRPSVVAEIFPDERRDYAVRALVNLETVNELVLYVRARAGVNLGGMQVDSSLERGYAFAILPEFVVADYPDGVIAIAEFTGCHETVPHLEWPNANEDGFGQAAPGDFRIVNNDWYWIEVTSQGNDNGGPVLLTCSLWPEDEEPPAAPQLTVVDPDGLTHTAATLDPANEIQILFGTSFDFGQQVSATARVDELTITTIGGCSVAPVVATRSLWEGLVVAEGRSTALYREGETYEVRVALADRRPAGQCPAAGMVRIVESAPPGWEVSAPANGGQVVGDNVVEWNLDLAGGGGGGLPELSYTVSAVGTGRVEFAGEISEPGSGFRFVVGGPNVVVTEDAVRPVSDFGSIQHWLILGPFTRQVGGANPGAEEIARDYLTDGETTEADICPRAGDTITPDYDGEAASTGLAMDLFGRNPGGVPTWVPWIDFDDANDRVDFEAVYGDLNEVMCYALTYLNVEEDTVVNLGVSSDDAIQVLLDGESIHLNAVARGALGRSYQDLPFQFEGLGNITLTEGQHSLMVKVFEGGGEHNFRVGFVDETGLEIDGGPDGVEVTLDGAPCEQAPEFIRGDADGNGTLELTDGVFVFNWLFLGGPEPGCLDAADASDQGDVNLTSGIYVLNFLFLGGPAPPSPMPPACGVDPTADAIDCASYTRC